MALLCNNVQDTTVTVGTGQYTLANAVPAGAISTLSGAGAPPTTFATALTYGGAVAYPINNVFYYVTNAATGDFELGIGNLLSATLLARVNVLWSSSGGQLVNWAAGTKNVYSNPNLVLGTQGSWQRTLFSALPENDVVEGQVSLSMTTGATAGAAQLVNYKIDNAGRVTLTVQAALTVTAAGTNAIITGIPAFLSNVQAVKYNPCVITSAGVNALGAFTVTAGAGPDATGTLTFYQTSAALSAVFTTGVVNGVPACDLTWSLI